MTETWCPWHSRYCRRCWVQKGRELVQTLAFFAGLTAIGMLFVLYSERIDAFVNHLVAIWDAMVAVAGVK